MDSNVTERLQMLENLLITLARFLQENEKVLSLKEYKGCYEKLPNGEREYIERLPQTLEHLFGNKGGKGRKGADRREGDNEDSDESGQSDESVESVDEEDRDGGWLDEGEDDGDEQEDNGTECAGGSREKGAPSWDDRRRLPSISKLTIRSSIYNILESCKIEKGPGPFFQALSQDIPTNGGLIGAYFKICRYREIGDIIKIHRRFDLYNFYLLATEYRYCFRNRLLQGAAKELAAGIRSRDPSLGTIENIKKRLHSIVGLGRGYDAWVSELGHSGYLIALPLHISETEAADMFSSAKGPVSQHYQQQSPAGQMALPSRPMQSRAQSYPSIGAPQPQYYTPQMASDNRSRSTDELSNSTFREVSSMLSQPDPPLGMETRVSVRGEEPTTGLRIEAGQQAGRGASQPVERITRHECSSQPKAKRRRANCQTSSTSESIHYPQGLQGQWGRDAVGHDSAGTAAESTLITPGTVGDREPAVNSSDLINSQQLGDFSRALNQEVITTCGGSPGLNHSIGEYLYTSSFLGTKSTSQNIWYFQGARYTARRYA
ncbi:hypothetical protein A7C99_4480 [Trichophyton rubrum]|uniref:Uncharacterized protein n=1 Tax=Trichophyton rubrum TaxID=5551 RepID=A0A178EV93_TRIRU|nr:hypothetical protein A7C99_4480 [Trichophyton rubrum]